MLLKIYNIRLIIVNRRRQHLKFDGKKYHSIWYDRDKVYIIDQRSLPEKFVIEKIRTSKEMIAAITDMHLRGAPLIGVAGAYGTFFAYRESFSKPEPEEYYENMISKLRNCRPTAVNLSWGVQKIDGLIKMGLELDRVLAAVKTLERNEIECCKRIGANGVALIREIFNVTGRTVNIMTHCNAGWLATVNYGTASAPVFRARDEEINIHVWVSETRPRNQGGKLTAWEYFHENISHTVVSDSSCGHLMQNKMVDLVIVGADRIAKNGDTANKIGTYLKALAAKYNNIPFYIAAPVSTIDFSIKSGRDIPIEERDENELKYMNEAPLIHELSPALNYAFDITPAELITGFITEKGIFKPAELLRLTL
ncbi:MAG TPA: S-methyl-5-thioribose-1-phosphate isomerase [Clostridiales bacterium]|mgnify:CR=1 FL=1|nr:S-methyl-5-thioribose-1-phosphate isomerase [Clostridiales bacterium]HQP69648.1 S-methyl-5-thioribose-1-phosphate isomerase [Clostridiales bacterium]